MGISRLAPAALHGAWLHSHEEDTADHVVYRPASFAFPPSRGREGFELRPGGALVETGIGPTDRRTQSSARWALDSGGRLRFYDRANAAKERALEIESVHADRLVLKRPPES